MTILEEMFTGNSQSSQLTKTNYQFFSTYLNKDIIIQLIDIKNNYLSLVNYNKNNEEDMLKEQLSKLYHEYKKLKIKRTSLLKRKVYLLRNIIDETSSNIIEEDQDINKQLISIVAEEKGIKDKIVDYKKQLNDLENNKMSYDLLLNQLRNKLDNLNDPLIITSMLYEKKDKYKKLIKDMITNEKAKNCYINYIFEMITNDIDNLMHFFNLAGHLISIEDIDELDNTSVLLEYNLNKDQNRTLNKFINIVKDKNISNNSLNDISDEYLKNKTIINAMMHYAKNYKTLFNNHLLGSEYKVIEEMTLSVEKEKEDINNSLYSVKNNASKLRVSFLEDIIAIFKSFYNLISHQKLKLIY